nr:MAG TPA: hypothetical protein [Caudoviricetes sp.]
MNREFNITAYHYFKYFAIKKFNFRTNKATEQVSGSTLPLRAICVYIYIPDYQKLQEL